MALGILLHALGMMNSDLGLDAHVRLNAAMDETATGQDLACLLYTSDAADDQ